MHDWMLEMYLLDCETNGWEPSFKGARAYRDTYSLRQKWLKCS